ncbi:MAG: large conductance mechanosensitive channel protein MscL [Christensenellaceae bacterium]|jgi:large conductance mechanosensitive channel
MKKAKKGFFTEFREFISRGSVMDLAVGVIIGAAFTAIVNSLVEDIIMPFIGLITGGIDFSSLSFQIGDVTIKYGSFIGAVINFVLIALIIFLFIKGINKMRRPKDEEPEKPARLCPYCKMEIADDATKCPYCTADLPASDAASKA